MSSQDIINFLIEPEFKGLLLYIKAAFILASTLLLLGIIVLTSKTTWLDRRTIENSVELMTFKPFKPKDDLRTWERIRKKIDGKKESDYKLAVIEADSLLEKLLEKTGCKGNTMEERLNKAKSVIAIDLSDVRKAHSIRNNIVYDPDYKLTFEEAKKTIDDYEKFFRNTEMF